MEEKLKNDYAVISTGGKQYVVSAGQKIKVELLPGSAGDAVVFDQVLLVKAGENDAAIGTPVVEGASVNATIIASEKDKKVIIFKKRRRKGYKMKQGHRQILTEVEINAING